MTVGLTTLDSPLFKAPALSAATPAALNLQRRTMGRSLRQETTDCVGPANLCNLLPLVPLSKHFPTTHTTPQRRRNGGHAIASPARWTPPTASQ